MTPSNCFGATGKIGPPHDTKTIHNRMRSSAPSNIWPLCPFDYACASHAEYPAGIATKPVVRDGRDRGTRWELLDVGE